MEQRFFEQATPGKGFVKPERVAAIDLDYKFQGSKPDAVVKGSRTSYASGCIYPFPVTGKKTGEEELNLKLGIKIGR